MPSPVPDGMMRTARGIRFAARPDTDGGIILVVFGIEIKMTADESARLRDVLHDAEVRAARGEVDE